MPRYCTTQDVRDRVSDAGVLFVGDDDFDGTVESADTDLIDQAIDQACCEIDMYLSSIFDDPQTTLDGNVWLKFACVDLAANYFCGRKGQKVPGFKEQADDRIVKLAAIAKGELRIPGAVYPVDSTSIDQRQAFGLPRVAQPGGC